MANVLIIDDDVHICRMLSSMVDRLDHKADSANTIKEGLELAESGIFDVIFLDVGMPDGSGLDLLPKIREIPFPPEVIIITGLGEADGAELAIKNGAWDYLQKPLSPKKIILPLKRILQYRDDIKQAAKPPVVLKFDNIIGRGQRIRECYDSLALAASSDANVLITGESGTGKELFARAIHNNSKRSASPMVVVDCAALPDTLVESALFGHEKGAFTSADRDQEGLIKQANNGTLFLDEIGELPLAVQTSFLRVLEDKKFRKIGSVREEESNFRIVAATNRDLDQAVDEGIFRKDLLYRLKSVAVELPPLRERTEDIRDLILHYVPHFCEKYEVETKGYSPDFFDMLQEYDWPGNVRELMNTLERAVVAAQFEPTLYIKHLPMQLRVLLAKASIKPAPQALPAAEPEASTRVPQGLPSFKEFRESVVAEQEKKYLKDLMALTQGSINEACRVSGLSRTWLYNMMKKHNVSRMGWDSFE